MKNQVGIWLDSANATIVSLKEKNQDVNYNTILMKLLRT